jgi:hypothetical protein
MRPMTMSRVHLLLPNHPGMQPKEALVLKAVLICPWKVSACPQDLDWATHPSMTGEPLLW